MLLPENESLIVGFAVFQKKVDERPNKNVKGCTKESKYVKNIAPNIYRRTLRERGFYFSDNDLFLNVISFQCPMGLLLVAWFASTTQFATRARHTTCMHYYLRMWVSIFLLLA